MIGFILLIPEWLGRKQKQFLLWPEKKNIVGHFFNFLPEKKASY